MYSLTYRCSTPCVVVHVYTHLQLLYSVCCCTCIHSLTGAVLCVSLYMYTLTYSTGALLCVSLYMYTLTYSTGALLSVPLYMYTHYTHLHVLYSVCCCTCIHSQVLYSVCVPLYMYTFTYGTGALLCVPLYMQSLCILVGLNTGLASLSIGPLLLCSRKLKGVDKPKFV